MRFLLLLPLLVSCATLRPESCAQTLAVARTVARVGGVLFGGGAFGALGSLLGQLEPDVCPRGER